MKKSRAILLVLAGTLIQGCGSPTPPPPPPPRVDANGVPLVEKPEDDQNAQNSGVTSSGSSGTGGGFSTPGTRPRTYSTGSGWSFHVPSWRSSGGSGSWGSSSSSGGSTGN